MSSKVFYYTVHKYVGTTVAGQHYPDHVTWRIKKHLVIDGTHENTVMLRAWPKDEDSAEQQVKDMMWRDNNEKIERNAKALEDYNARL